MFLLSLGGCVWNTAHYVCIYQLNARPDVVWWNWNKCQFVFGLFLVIDRSSGQKTTSDTCVKVMLDEISVQLTDGGWGEVEEMWGRLTCILCSSCVEMGGEAGKVVGGGGGGRNTKRAVSIQMIHFEQAPCVRASRYMLVKYRRVENHVVSFWSSWTTLQDWKRAVMWTVLLPVNIRSCIVLKIIDISVRGCPATGRDSRMTHLRLL